MSAATSPRTQRDVDPRKDWETPVFRSFIRDPNISAEVKAFLLLLDDLSCERRGVSRAFGIVHGARLARMLPGRKGKPCSKDTIARRFKAAGKTGYIEVVWHADAKDHKTGRIGFIWKRRVAANRPIATDDIIDQVRTELRDAVKARRQQRTFPFLPSATSAQSTGSERRAAESQPVGPQKCDANGPQVCGPRPGICSEESYTHETTTTKTTEPGPSSSSSSHFHQPNQKTEPDTPRIAPGTEKLCMPSRRVDCADDPAVADLAKRFSVLEGSHRDTIAGWVTKHSLELVLLLIRWVEACRRRPKPPKGIGWAASTVATWRKRLDAGETTLAAIKAEVVATEERFGVCPPLTPEQAAEKAAWDEVWAEMAREEAAERVTHERAAAAHRRAVDDFFDELGRDPERRDRLIEQAIGLVPEHCLFTFGRTLKNPILRERVYALGCAADR